MTSLRLFIAAELTSEQHKATADLMERLRKGIGFTPAHPKWVSPDSLHITLSFLGDVEENRVKSIVHAVESRLVKLTPAEFDLHGIGTFPNERQPTVLWIGAHHGADRLKQIQSAVESALVPLGFSPERREFHPHVTLARINALRGVAPMMKIVTDHRKFGAPLGTIDSITLFQSELLPSGARYTALHRWPLGQSNDATRGND
jgi:2'-5' RNA ligase